MHKMSMIYAQKTKKYKKCKKSTKKGLTIEKMVGIINELLASSTERSLKTG